MDQSDRRVKASLKQIYGDKLNEIYKLSGFEVLIGRSPRSQICLQNPSISRQHCVLTYSDKGWIVKDKNSQNGTYVNGKQLKPAESYCLEVGDILFLGPPSECPQAFSYDETYPSEEDMEVDMNVDDIVELPVKRPYEDIIECSPEKNVIKKACNEIDNLKNPFENDLNLLEFKSPIKQTQPLRNRFSSSPSNSPRKVLPKISGRKSSRKSARNVKTPKDKAVSRVSHILSQDSEPLVLASSSKDTDCFSQIYEISSTGSDFYFEDSESLLHGGGQGASNSFSQRSTEEYSKSEIKIDDAVSSENDLESKLALYAEQIKALQESKLELLKKYEEVSEKNKELDEELAKKEEKLKEDLQKHEIKAKNELKSQLLQKFEEDLVCTICTELFIKPTVLDCSHTFCEFCIKEWRKRKNDCPTCRCKIKNVTHVRTLEEFIDKALATLTPEQREKRNVLVTERIRAEQPPPKSPRSVRRRRRGRNSRVGAEFMRGMRNARPNTADRDPSIQILEESNSRPRSSYFNLQVPSTEDLNLHVNLPVLDIPMLRFFFS